MSLLTADKNSGVSITLIGIVPAMSKTNPMD